MHGFFKVFAILLGFAIAMAMALLSVVLAMSALDAAVSGHWTKAVAHGFCIIVAIAVAAAVATLIDNMLG